MPSLNTPNVAAETLLIAGPPAANPPLFIAIIVVMLSVAAPFLFLRAGSPSIFLGFAAIALAAAGIITFYGAVRAQRKRRLDAALRPRARISAAGITLHLKPDDQFTQHIAAEHISTVRLLAGALIVQTTISHPNSGRYVLRFGKLATPHDTLMKALLPFNSNNRGKTSL